MSEPPDTQSFDAGVRRLPRLDRMHNIGIAVLALLVVASQVLLQRGLAREIDDGPVMNMASRQRMLSQRITKVAVLALQAKDDSTRRQLRAELAGALAEWTHAAQVLSERADSLSRRTSVHTALQSDLQTVDFAHESTVRPAERLLSLLSDPQSSEAAMAEQVRRIVASEPDFLNSMEAVVTDFEQAAREHVQEVRTLSLILCIGILLMLLYEGTLVFRPAFAVMREQFNALKAELNRRLDVETTLRASERWATSLIEQMQTGIMVFDQDGRITAANASCERLFGMPDGGMLGKEPHDLFTDAQSHDARTFRAIAPSILGRIVERTGRRSDGSVFPCDVSASLVHLPSGLSILCDVRDTTERREVERLKKEFVSTVSHELRTPLTSIRGSLGLLSGGVLGELPGEAREVVTIAERNVVRLIALINDILDLEKLDAGKLEMNFQPVPVQALMDRAAEAVRGFGTQERVDITVAPTTVLANADADRIVQVLVNLLSNAIKFSPAGGSVEMQAEEIGQEIEIRVIDHGRGIPPDALELIFERFRQVDSSDARGKGGTGLGLAISRAIMVQHMGSITVTSTLGLGSTFLIRMPKAVASEEPAPVQTAPAVEAVARTRGIADVLLVDDDPSFAQVTKLKLAQSGVFTRIANSGRAAAQMVRERLPGLLVLDVSLRDIDGFELVAVLKNDPAARNLPLLVYSGRDIEDEEREHLVLGPTRFLTKSRVSDDELVAAVDDLLRRPGAYSDRR